MRFIPLLACAAVLVACAGSEKAPPDSATAAPAAAAAPATLSLADLTGKWTQQVRAENSDRPFILSLAGNGLSSHRARRV